MYTSRPKRGVTLVELLVVMSIIAVLAGTLGLMATSVARAMNEQKTWSIIHKLTAVIELYHEDCGQYPDAINHDPSRKLHAATCSMHYKRNEISPDEPAGCTQGSTTTPCFEHRPYYPESTNPNRMRPLYQSYIDENTQQPVECTELVCVLASPSRGWGNAQFFEHFKRSQLNGKGQLVDAWGRRIFYMSAVAYRRYVINDPDNISSGTTTGGIHGGSFINPDSYQIYSAGVNLCTPPDMFNQAGTEPDDLTNW